MADLYARHVGEYGHYVQPLPRLLEELEGFIGGAGLARFGSEARSLEREGQGVHPEEAAILYAVVRGRKPDFVLETGTYKGYSTGEIARALEANGSGHVVTVDVDPEAGAMVPDHLRNLVTFHRGVPPDALSEILAAETSRIDLFFHDSLHTYRHTLSELVWVAPFLSDDAIIICHDAKMDFHKDFGVGRSMREFAEVARVPFVVLDTTCGLGLLRWRGGIGTDRIEVLKERLRTVVRRERVERVVRGVARRLGGLLGT